MRFGSQLAYLLHYIRHFSLRFLPLPHVRERGVVKLNEHRQYVGTLNPMCDTKYI